MDWKIWFAIIIVVFFIFLIIYSLYEPFEDKMIDIEKNVRRNIGENIYNNQTNIDLEDNEHIQNLTKKKLRDILLFTYGVGAVNGAGLKQSNAYNQDNHEQNFNQQSNVRISEIIDDEPELIESEPELIEPEHNNKSDTYASDWTVVKGPVCSKRSSSFVSKGEAETKSSLKRIFGKDFYTTRPNFLKNPSTGKNLELDCYNHELSFAIEYNGRQHYEFPNGFHSTEAQFIKQVERDRFKRNACDNNGIYLLSIPWTVPHADIEQYIRDRLPKTLLKYRIS